MEKCCCCCRCCCRPDSADPKAGVMSRPRDPRSSLPAKRLKANPRDHVAAWLEEEFVFDEGYVQPGALFKAYEWWCACRKAQNRQLTPVMLLDRLKADYGIEPRILRFYEDGHDKSVYAMSGIRFRHDESLNARLKIRGA